MLPPFSGQPQIAPSPAPAPKKPSWPMVWYLAAFAAAIVVAAVALGFEAAVMAAIVLAPIVGIMAFVDLVVSLFRKDWATAGQLAVVIILLAFSLAGAFNACASSFSFH